MRVILLNLPDPPDYYVSRDYCGGFGSAFPSKRRIQHNMFPPLFDAYAAAVLENEGHDVSILDCQAQNFASSNLVKDLKKEHPDVVISRICLPFFERDLHAISMIKKWLSETVFPDDISVSLWNYQRMSDEFTLLLPGYLWVPEFQGHLSWFTKH